MGRKLLHLLNGLITCAVTVVLVVAGAYAGYALWDNQQIYNAAENAHSEMKEIRETLGIPNTLSAMEKLLEENRREKEAKAAEAADATQIPAITEEDSVTEIPETVETPDTEDPAEEEAVTDTSVPAVVIADSIPTAETGPAADPSGVKKEAIPAPTATPAPTPAPTEKPDDSLMAQLKTINEDITAWLTLPGTAIDYPVMQGSSNFTYINTDVHGDFAMAGSIFLDYRNSEDYTDVYSLLYGHNMTQHKMFSDINLYKEEEFFDEHTLGMMYTKDGWHVIESLSVIVTYASDSGVFNPANWTNLDGEGIYRMVQENALFTCEKGLEDLREQIDAGETPRLISLSTCSNEFTDARTILLTLLDP